MYIFNSPIVVAKWLLSKQSMTPQKLQKMLYYEYVWFLVLLNDNTIVKYKLFPGNFKNGTDGPVNTQVYHYYRQKGYHKNDKIPPAKHFQLKIENVSWKNRRNILYNLNRIYELYIGFDNDYLISLTHRELPENNTDIKDSSIYNYYQKILG